MTYKPRDTDDVYEDLRDSLTNKISKLTNFTERSFNYVWTRAFARQVRELEVQNLAAQFSGWVEYAGGPITKDDLDELGVPDHVSPEDIEEYNPDQSLDELVKLVGVRRFEGVRATGSVDITTQLAETPIPEGTKVTTPTQGPDGETKEFITTERRVSEDQSTEVKNVPVQAVNPGEEYNVPAGTVVRLDSPPIGTKGVINNEAITGGEDRESNDELRERAKKAVQESSNGGTTAGIKGYIREEIESVGQGDITIDESVEEQPPTVDVVVDGGNPTKVKEAIEFSRPVGIKHRLLRPQVIQIGFRTAVRGTEIDSKSIEGQLTNYILNLNIGDNIYRDRIIQQVLQVDEGITNISSVGGYIEKVINENFTYNSSVTDYNLDFTYDATNGNITITDSNNDEYTEGADFTVEDKTGDTYKETIVWDSNATTPNDGEEFFVEYDVTVPSQTASEDYYELDSVRDSTFVWNQGYTEERSYNETSQIYKLDYVPFTGDNLSITDGNNNTYNPGTDFDIIDDTGNGVPQSIDWSIGGSSPNDNVRFEVQYTQKIYQTKYNIRNVPEGGITDSNGNELVQGTDFNLASYNKTNEVNAIEFTQNSISKLSDGQEFYISYKSTGDRQISDKQKVETGEINITVI